MDTQVRKLDYDSIDSEIMKEAGDIIRAGGLVAFPTETVYGLGGDALNPESSKKIYAAKGRPSDNPLIVHIEERADLYKIAAKVPEKAEKMMDAFWPGPLTLIFPKTDRVPSETTGGQAVIGLESTIVDMSVEPPVILRPGAITKDMMEAVIGPVEIDKAIIAPNSGVKPKAPGMKYRHYAPRADLTIVEGPSDKVVETMNRMAAEAEESGKKVGIIATDETKSRYPHGIVMSLGARSNEEEIAQHLFEVLRKFDDTDVECIFSESFEDAAIGAAIMNRLLKAAGHKVVRV